MMIRIVAAAAVLALVPAAARADTLDKALGGLADDVKKLLTGKEAAVTLAGISPHPKSHVALHSSGGTAIVQKLRAHLERVGVAVQRASTVTVSGTFREAEGESGRQVVEIEAKVYDRSTGKENEKSALVLNEVDVAHLLGLPLEYPGGAKESERHKALKKEVDKFVPPAMRHPKETEWGEKPAPTLDDTVVRAAKGSPFGIEVRVAPPDPMKDGKRTPADYAPRKAANDGGLAFAKIARGELYAVRLVNDAAFDCAVSLTIDGLSMFVVSDKEFRDPKTGKPNFNHVIVPAKSSVLVRGWFVSLTKSDEFKVTAYADSLAAELKTPTTPGVINACFHAAVKPDEAFPPGEPLAKENAFDASATGRGARFDMKYEVVPKKIGALRAQAAVRYDRP